MARKVIEKNIAYDDKKDLYYVTLNYGKDGNGKRIKKTETFKEKRDAKRRLKEFEADKTKGNLVIPQKITVGEWLDYWMQDIIMMKDAETTCYAYGLMIKNHIKPAIGNIPLQDIKAMQIQKYLNTVGKTKNLSPVTVKKHYALLKTAFDVAVKQDYLLTNIVDKVEPPKVERKEVECYNAEEMSALLALIKDHELELCVKLAAYLGLRRGEYCGLKWSNVDFDNRTISIVETRTSAGNEIIEKGTKTKSSIRKLSIPDDLYDLLLKEKKVQEENKELFGDAYGSGDYVLVRADGMPIRPNRLSEKFTKFIEEHDFPKITLHGLRHSFASNANLSGASIFDISKALGHSTTGTTTKVYMHMFDDVQKSTIDGVAKLYGNVEKNS